LAFSVGFLYSVPARGIAVIHGLAWISLFVFPPIAVLSGLTLLCLRRGRRPQPNKV
jgi:hypothetical protein